MVSQIRITILSVLKSLIFIVLLYAIEHFSTIYWYSNGGSFPKWLINFQNWLPKPRYPDDNGAVVELLSVIASVSGVILALFYPILATIASTAYAKVHASVRNLLLYAKETQAYLRRLTYLTAYSIEVLLFYSCHLYPGNLILYFLSLYAFTTLFGILKIGFGVYNFFEPSTLSNIVVQNLNDAIKNVTIQGVYWNDRNFQSHYYKLAFEQTENLSLLISLCLKDGDIRETSFKSIFNNSVFALLFYLQFKPQIPTDSKWYPEYYKHKSFFESNLTERQLSQNTSMFVLPKLLPNHFWMEERIVSNLSRGLKSVVESGHVNILSESLSMTQRLFSSLSSKLDLKTGTLLLDNLLANMILLDNKNVKGDSGDLEYEDCRKEIICVQAYCHVILGFLVGVLDVGAKFDSKKILNEYNRIDWRKVKSIYNTDFVPDLYKVLNRFQSEVENEKFVERKMVTPAWYFQQSLASEYLSLITERLKDTILLFDSHLIALASSYDKGGNPLLATFCCQIGLEVLSKLRYRLVKVKTALKSIDNLEICKNEFNWRGPDFDDYEEILSQYERGCYNIITRNIESLSGIKWNNQFPDIFAQSYSIILTHLNDCLAKRNLVDFQEAFPPFLKACLNSFGNLNFIFKHYDIPQIISYQTLLDLLEVSGYAFIYSIIYRNDSFWEIVKESWARYFSPSKENIELFAKLYQYYKVSLSSTGVNFGEKHKREMTLKEIAEKIKLEDYGLNNFVVKLFIRKTYEFSHYDVAELFIEVYLFSFLNAKSATMLIKKREVFERWLWYINNPNPSNSYGF